MKRKKLFLFMGIIICISIAAAFLFVEVKIVGKAVVVMKKDHKKKPELPAGRWSTARYLETKEDNEETFKKLIGLGYLEGYKPVGALENVTIFNKELVSDGLNFFVSGHGPEAIVMDMEGKVLHTWRYRNACEIWENVSCNNPGSSYWRRGHLFENGDLLAIYEGIGLIKLDKESNLLWSYSSSRAPHHDLEVIEDGTIYVLTMEKKKIPHISRTDVYDEFISILSPEGKLKEEFSLIDAIEKSPYARLLDNDYVKKGGFYGHILHTNTIEVFDGRLSHLSPLFKKGNVLLSLLIVSTIAIVDSDQREVVWALGSGMWKFQHQPTLLEHGTLLLFDNHDTDDASQVIEFNPFTQEILWEYRGDALSPFFSKTCGSNQRLPNGNTLITETDNGRAFEVTPDGTIVWEYINPFRAGEKKELIASLFEMIRINPAEYDFIQR